jgi:hypothetical protein
MMGMRIPETCWAVFKRQVPNLRSCCILLVGWVERYPVIIRHSSFDSFILWFVSSLFIHSELYSLKLTQFNYSDCGWLRNTATGSNQVTPLKCCPLSTVNLRTGVHAHFTYCSAWFVSVPTALLISRQLGGCLSVCSLVNTEQFKVLNIKGR